MAKRELITVTKKQVDRFIASKMHLFKDKEEFIAEIDNLLLGVRKWDRPNSMASPNQTKFYERVKEKLAQ